MSVDCCLFDVWCVTFQFLFRLFLRLFYFNCFLLNDHYVYCLVLSVWFGCAVWYKSLFPGYSPIFVCSTCTFWSCSNHVIFFFLSANIPNIPDIRSLIVQFGLIVWIIVATRTFIIQCILRDLVGIALFYQVISPPLSSRHMYWSDQDLCREQIY